MISSIHVYWLFMFFDHFHFLTTEPLYTNLCIRCPCTYIDFPRLRLYLEDWSFWFFCYIHFRSIRSNAQSSWNSRLWIHWKNLSQRFFSPVCQISHHILSKIYQHNLAWLDYDLFELDSWKKIRTLPLSTFPGSSLFFFVYFTVCTFTPSEKNSVCSGSCIFITDRIIILLISCLGPWCVFPLKFWFKNFI